MAADLDHWWGGDLSLSPSGDLATVTVLDRDNQRIVRRLCTNGANSGAQLAEYIWEPEYGGSAPWYVGQTANEAILGGIIRTQMYEEQSVSQDPEPSITVTVNPDGTFQALIQYTDNTTKLLTPKLLLGPIG